MTLLLGSIGNSAPQWPPGKDPYTWASSVAPINSVPSTLNDGSYLLVTSANVTLYNSAGVAVWTKLPTDVNASGSTFCARCWVDTVDNAIWGIAFKSDSLIGYPFKMAISTGAVTAIGTGFATTLAFISTVYLYLTRAAQGSGDFTLYGVNASGFAMNLQFSSTTGALTLAITKVLSGGLAINAALLQNPSIGYRSLDGTILVGFVVAYTATNATTLQLVLIRNGKQALFDPSHMVGYNPTTNITTLSLTVVGSTVVPSNSAQTLPIMLRIDVDTFLATACTYMGI